MQDLDIYEDDNLPEDSAEMQCFQRWMSALLLGAPNLTSLNVRTDGVPWPPVLGLMSLHHLELNMWHDRPWLDSMMADLSFCSCLETLKLGNDGIDPDVSSPGLCADIFLRDVTTLKSVEVYNWYPEQEFKLPVGCLLRLAVVLETCSQWDEWHRRGCPFQCCIWSA